MTRGAWWSDPSRAVPALNPVLSRRARWQISTDRGDVPDVAATPDVENLARAERHPAWQAWERLAGEAWVLRWSSREVPVRFPGRRKHKHYFPVHARDPLFQAMGVDGATALHGPASARASLNIKIPPPRGQ